MAGQSEPLLPSPVSSLKLSTIPSKTTALSELKHLKSYFSWENSFPLSKSHRVKTFQLEDPVNTLSISPDIKHLVIGIGKNIQIWDLSTETMLYNFEAHEQNVTSLGFSFDSSLIISGSGDKIINIWDLKGNKIFDFQGHSDGIESVVFSPYGDLLASAGKDCVIKVWSYYEKMLLFDLVGHKSTINSMSYSSSSSYLASGADCIKIWDLNAKQELFTLEIECAYVYCISFSPDEKKVAIGTSNNLVCIWNLLTRKEEIRFTEHSSFVYSLSFSPNGKYLATSSGDYTVKVWNLLLAREELLLEGHTQKVNTVSFSSDGMLIVSGSDDRTFKFWDFKQYCSEITLKGHSSGIMSLACCNSSSLIISSANDKSLKVWSLETQKEINKFTEGGSYVYSVDLHPNSSLVASGSSDKIVKVWNLLDTQISMKFKGHTKPIRCVKFSPDGLLLASCSEDKTIKLWNLSNQSEEFTLEGHGDSVNSICFAMNGLYLASGSTDNLVKVWDLQNKIVYFTYEGHSEKVNSVVFTPDSKFLASGSDDNMIKIWNVVNKREERTLRGHNEPVLSVDISKDGLRLASGSSDNTVNIWNLVEKRKEYSLCRSPNAVRSVIFSSTSEKLIIGSEDRLIRIIDLEDSVKSFSGVALTYDNKLHATSSTDKIFLTDSSDKRKKHELLNHSTACNKLILSPNSNFLVVGFEDETLSIWDCLSKTQKFVLNSYPNNIWEVHFTNTNELVLKKNNGNLKVFSLETGIERISGNVNIYNTSLNLDLDTLYEPKHEQPYSYFNFLYCLHSKQFNKLTFESTDSFFTNLHFTGLHILTIMGLADDIQRIANYYKFTLKTDKFGHTAIYYSIQMQNQNCTDALLNYLISLADDIKDLVFIESMYAIRNDISDIIKNSASCLDLLLHKSLFSKTGEVHFGEPKSSLPIICVMDIENSSFNDFVLEFQTGQNVAMTIKSLAFPIPLTLGSEESIDLLQSILSCKNTEIFRTEAIQHIIINRWDALKFWIYAYTFLLWTIILFIILILAITDYSLYFSIALFVMNLFCLIWEILQLSQAGLSYFTVTWNIIDIFRIFCTFAWIFLNYLHFIYPWFLWITVFLNLIRGVTGFRAFDTTRYYIRLILQSLNNVKSFIIIYLYTTFCFGFLRSILDENPEISFSSIWANPFGLSIGENGKMMSESFDFEYLTLFLAIIVNVILMLNMIISILGDSFDEFQLKAVIYNFTEMTEVILDIENIKNVFNPIGSSKYLHACTYAYENTENQWTGKVMNMRAHFDIAIRELENKFVSKVEAVEVERRKDAAKMDSGLMKIEAQIASLVSKMEKLSDRKS
ncbi:hypothetical protein SteCoe_18621 [Stentor coeruleus]|uniref:Uncharacterized protein n=1 Tax=Stentor coeruleus TaxID=5963 RepID=A0A1R2BW40_9CILI|nr:hypothetical protein SteCoe_18621 [Stentor coeruleus]